MQELSVYDLNGLETGRTARLDPAVFDVEPNDHVIWLDVRSTQANARQGTHKSKERGEVRGGGSKPWRQKGTGRARVGTIRSPLWVGGGRTFGPRPHKYQVGINKKSKQLARRSALTYKAREEAIRVVEDFHLDTPRTRTIADLVSALDLADSKVLLLTSKPEVMIYKSGRNLPKVEVRDASSVSTFDVLNAQIVLCQEGALDVLSDLLGDAGTPVAEPVEDAQ